MQYELMYRVSTKHFSVITRIEEMGLIPTHQDTFVPSPKCMRKEVSINIHLRLIEALN